MFAIITGNIVSRGKNGVSESVLDSLKSTLLMLGLRPYFWEIFLGTSFQAISDDPAKALKTAILIKAAVKAHKGVDVRISVGIGKIDYRSSKVTECQGEAFSKSLIQFDYLTATQQSLGINTPWSTLNEFCQVSIPLIAALADNWKPSTANIVRAYLAQNEPRQTDLALSLGLSQASVSSALKRAHWFVIADYLNWIEQQITQRASLL